MEHQASHYKTRQIDRGVGKSKRFDDSFATPFGRTEVDEQNLVVSVIDDGSKFFTKGEQFGRAELAFEDAVLKMVATSANRFENFLKPFVVANVLADQIGRPHGMPSQGIGLRNFVRHSSLCKVEIAQHSNCSSSFSSIQKETDRQSRFQPDCQRASRGVRGTYGICLP